MALLNPTFVFGIFVLVYLSSFVLFAILRILTGISIQRIGYFSLRRIAYTPKDGVKLEIRGLGINLHRPTFGQPTWISIVLTELAITVDLSVTHGHKSLDNRGNGEINGEAKGSQAASQTKSPMPTPESSRGRSWERLTSIKERIKRLHRRINWIRMFDVVATNSTVTILDVGQIQIGSFTMAVDTRRKMVDRGRMFSHSKSIRKEQRPAEWMITTRSVLFTPDGGEELEVLDYGTLNIHGFLYKELDGLRDAAISIKLGRVHIPYDDINTCFTRYKACQKVEFSEYSDVQDIPILEVFHDASENPASREMKLGQTVSDSKDFINSILRGIKEVQFAVSFVGFTKLIKSVQPRGSPVYLNASMKEVGVDLHRLDQKSPAHRMYFSSKDVAHQALIAALSIAIGVDDGRGISDRLVYIPMATTTIRTTLPSKTIQFAEDNSADERNANILFANIVITSPSVDLDPRHLPLVLAALRMRSSAKKETAERRHVLISRLLPKANVKISMHEPVIRIALPPVEVTADEDDFDLIISSISSVSLDIESSHSAVGDAHYALASTLRIQAHDLYYQTSSGLHYDLLETDSLELKIHLSASPDVFVVATGNLQTFSIHLIRPEISDGVRQIVRQLRLDVEPDKKRHSTTNRDPNFIRAVPSWLLHFQMQGSGFSAEVAGIDKDISDSTRGVALQLESWTAEYRAQKADALERRSSRRRAGSRSLTPDAELFLKMPQATKKQLQNPTDGRRLAIHVRGLEGFVVESVEKWEHEPFIAMPKFEIAFSTTSDNQGPILHLSSHVKTLLVQYSLYRHYACGVATTVLRKAFVRTSADEKEAERARAIAESTTTKGVDRLSPLRSPDQLYSEVYGNVAAARELVTLDFKSTLVQVKANMPADPPMMLQIYATEAGRHRWSPPFLQAKLARLYAEAPKIRQVWARIVTVKTFRVDLRENKRKRNTGETVDEKMIDISTEAIRLAIPHQFVLHKVVDNFVNTAKAVQQLHHRFNTGTNEYILEKRPEGPKHVPRVSLRSKALLFELEDGAFEWKLGTIFRTGLAEQIQRLARDAAFTVKTKKIQEEMRRESTRYRTKSARPRGQSNPPDNSRTRSKSVDSTDGRWYSDTQRGRKMRYDPEGSCGLNGIAKISTREALDKLQRHNAQSWKQRIDSAFAAAKSGMKDLRTTFWGPDELPDDLEDPESILEVPQRPSLMATLISDLHIILDKPSFPLSHLSDFIHRTGKGMPHEMQYALIVPMNIQLDMGEGRITLRDYPLPLVHVPAMKPGQSQRLPTWTLKTDFVIAEEFRGPQSTRHVKVHIVPPNCSQPEVSTAGGFAIDVRRTVSPVKTYSDINVDINTAFPTRITWGASYQPAIQDMMMIIETFTKPQIDPSARVGFWDKIRLGFHSRIGISWKGNGDVHLMLKGTRDPYLITGNGAGFLMCWRTDVKWTIARDPDPRKFMVVDSGEYILAIPDYSYQARGREKQGRDDDSVISSNSYKRGASFKKVAMKLSGNVQWLAGLMFERNEDGSVKRSFDSKPHYEVVFKEPQYAHAPPGLVYDAFRRFRSHHIHMSLAVKAPVDREWSVSNTTPSSTYNTVHLTPRFFTHFFAWWAMFNGTMSLPIRQGALWPGLEKSSKKFGRHLATIKYNLLLAPLYLAHIYKHKDAEDYLEDVVSATGLKMRLDSFILDVHQRREEFFTHDRGRKTQAKTTGMRMHKAQLDLLSADIRAVSASIAGTTVDDLRRASASMLSTPQDMSVPDLSRFVIPDNDLSWIDMDDFVELDWILPAEAHPETKILPLAYAPRFTYFRQTDHGDSISGDKDRTSPFGNETTHFCVMTKDNDPRRVQSQLIKNRLAQLGERIETHTRALGDAELKCIRDEDNPTYRADFEALSRHGSVLQDKKDFLESILRELDLRIAADQEQATLQRRGGSALDIENTMLKSDIEPAAETIGDFNNRFVIHNIQLKWNNLLRNIILRYIHQVSQRRGFVYYLSRRAVKFILDIVEEQNKSKATRPPQAYKKSMSPSSKTLDDDAAPQDVQDRIKELLADGKAFVSANDPQARDFATRTSTDNMKSNISREFTPQNSYYLRLIAPQIQLQSEKNPKSVVLVTAKGMELKVVEVMDKDRMFDDVSGLVQRRFSVKMDSTQFFVTNQKWFSSQLLSFYSGSRYGTPAGSAWPPWVPMEVIFDFEVDPFGFIRVVQKTSATLRYDKYNTLRLKYNDEVSSEGSHSSPDNAECRLDHLRVEFPQIRASCKSSQYYAMYIIVLDLLMYNEPLEKTRTERLEKIMLASDFSDLRGAPEMVIRLQERIKQLEEIKTQFLIHSPYLDKQGWEDRILLDRDLTSCEDELFFMMKAISTSQRKYDGSQTSGLLQWNIAADQIVWHLIRDNNEPLMEFQLQKAEYDRTDNSDGSHINLMQIGKIVGLNLLPDAVYPEMIAPYSDAERGTFNEGGNQQTLRVYWYMLEAIAGIPVMDHFEINLFPLKIQLEREVGQRLFEYMFPGSSHEKAGEGKKPAFAVKHIQPSNDAGDDDTTTLGSLSRLTALEGDFHDAARSTRAGSLELRLRPTMTSEAHSSSAVLQKTKGSSTHLNDPFHTRLKPPSSKASSSKLSSIKTLSRRPSNESFQSTATSRPALGRTPTIASSMDANSTNSDIKAKRFGISRNGQKSQKEKESDDLSKMISRASSYMTLAYVKIPSVVLCLSYKGKGERSIADVHDFVFRLPMIEYRNKTWSNLDLADALKRDVVRALISHTGAIIGNKFSKHRPNNAQQSRLREVATSSMLLTPSSNDNSYESSDASSTFANSPIDARSSERSKSPRRSFASSRNGLTRTSSASSSIVSVRSSGRVHGFPASLMMTPASGKAQSLKEMGDPNGKRTGGFVTSTFGRLKKKDRDSQAEESEDGSKRKSAFSIGKKILGSLNDS